MGQFADAPPRLISVGDVVATYSEPLRAWTAAQVTGVGGKWGITGQAGVLDLDWSGSEPDAIGDLGELRPLRLTHHAHRNRLSHINVEWLLPRTYKTLGSTSLIVEGLADGYSAGWRVGQQLAAQRRWEAGGPDRDPGDLSLTATDLAAYLERAAPMPDVWRVDVVDVERLNCWDLVTCFPEVSRLSLTGNLGKLENAGALQRLTGLRTLFIQDLFGMSPSDAVTVRHLPALEMLGLYSTPAEYASAMRRAWTPEIAHGTFLEVRSPRKPGWVEENRDNPLRAWDGREHISTPRYRKAVDEYRATRRSVIATLAAADGTSTSADLVELGRKFAQAFNRLDAGRSPFIETEEREDLFVALDAAVVAAEARHGRPFVGAREALRDGVDQLREW